MYRIARGRGGGGAGSGCRGHTANFSAHPKELGMLPSPSYLEMPAKAQMFSVRLPSLSTRHEGPPGPPGHASHAAGTVETTQESEGEREAVPSPPCAQPTPPPQVHDLMPPHQASPSSPPPPKDTSTHKCTPTHTHTHSPAKAHPQLCKPPACRSEHTLTHVTTMYIRSEAQSQPRRNGHSGPPSLTHIGVHRLAPQVQGAGMLRLLTGLPG